MPINPPPPSQAPPLKANEGKCLSFIVNNLFSDSPSSKKQKQVNLEVFLVSMLLQNKNKQRSKRCLGEEQKVGKVGKNRPSVKWNAEQELNISIEMKIYNKDLNHM